MAKPGAGIRRLQRTFGREIKADMTAFNKAGANLIDHLGLVEERAVKSIKSLGVRLFKAVSVGDDSLGLPGTPKDTGNARDSWEIAFRENRKGVIVSLTNGVEYILPLEFGHSKQAPLGFVRIAVQVFTKEINRRLPKDLNLGG